MNSMTDITELAQLRAELSNPAIGSKDHLRKLALSLVEALEKAQDTINDMDNRIRKQNRHVCELFDDNTALRQRIAELEDAEQKLCAANVTLDARAELAERQMAELESRKPDIYLCRVTRNGEELYSPCGADYSRGTGYHRSAPVESRTVTVKLPRWLVKDAIAVYDRDEIEDALTAAGIKWEAE
ncbi:TPA: hypothetical protein ACT1UY_001265 [Raoultella planticola]